MVLVCQARSPFQSRIEGGSPFIYSSFPPWWCSFCVVNLWGCLLRVLMFVYLYQFRMCVCVYVCFNDTVCPGYSRGAVQLEEPYTSLFASSKEAWHICTWFCWWLMCLPVRKGSPTFLWLCTRRRPWKEKGSPHGDWHSLEPDTRSCVLFL